MVHMSVNSKSQLSVWALVVGAFAVASGVQVLIYGAPSLFHFGGYSIPNNMGLPVTLLWMFGLATLATLVSIRLLRTRARSVGERVKVPSIVLVSLLALASTYVGIYISFNAWGT